MDFLTDVPSWDDIERNLDQQLSHLNQAVHRGIQAADDGWHGFTRHVSSSAIRGYGYVGGNQIDHVRHAMNLSYPIIRMDLTRKWASIDIAEILPVLLKLVQEVVMIVGGSVMVGAAVGGALGSLAFGAGALPGAAIGGGIGLQVGNLILAALGLYTVAGYFSGNLGPCLATVSEGLTTAWHAEEGLISPGLDPSGGSAAMIQERTERAARQLASGQEKLVMLLLMAIVTYLTRGQLRSGVIGSLDSVAARSAKLQAEITNKEFASWLAKNEQKLLSQPELQIKDPISLARAEPEPQPLRAHQDKKEESVGYIDPIEAARKRQVAMLENNQGFNVSPIGWDEYPTIGRNGTYISDKEAISSITGPLNIGGETVITKSQATQLEQAMGLQPGSMADGFKVRQVDGIREMLPHSPLQGNEYFLGAGNHLPGGGPEMVINSIPTIDSINVKTISTVIVK